jgi:DNA polymerase-3 subunit gamma/tau
MQLLDILGIVDRKVIYDLAAAILDGDVAVVLDVLDDVYDHGHDMKKLYADLLEHFRNLVVAAMGKKVDKLVDLPAGEIEQLTAQAAKASPEILGQIFDILFKQATAIRMSPQPRLAIEIAFIRMLQAKPALPIDVLIDKLDALRGETADREPSRQSNRQNESTGGPQQEVPLSSKASPGPDDFQVAPRGHRATGGKVAEPDRVFPGGEKDIWQEIKAIISQKNPSLAVSLDHCRLKEVTPDILTIEVPANGFYAAMMQRDKNMELMCKVCQQVCGGSLKVRLSSGDDPGTDNLKKKKQAHRLKQKALDHPLVADAIEIFDGKIVDVKIL